MEQSKKLDDTASTTNKESAMTDRSNVPQLPEQTSNEKDITPTATITQQSKDDDEIFNRMSLYLSR
jgi:hypothetical protein